MPERKLIDLDQAHQVTAPNGTVYNVRVDNSGNFYTEAAAQGIGSQAVALWKASSYSGSGQFLNDLSGNGHHLRLGSTQPAYIAQGALHLPGIVGDYASTPDSSALDAITGDIDIRCKAALPSWSAPPTTVNLFHKSAANGEFALQVRQADGYIIFRWADGASRIATSTVPCGIGAGETRWIRATLDANNGSGGHDVKFWLSYDGNTWTQLGATVNTGAFTTSIVPGTSPLEISVSGGANTVIGKVFYAEVRNGIDGTVVAKFDPSNLADHTTSWYSETGEQWTINSTAGTDTNEPKFLKYEGTKYLYLPGVTGNYVSVPDAANLDITGDIDIRAKLALDDWTATTDQIIARKWTGTGNQRSWEFRVNTSGRLVFDVSSDGISTSKSFTSSVAPTVADGADLWARVTLDADNGASGATANFYTSPDGSIWNILGTAQTIAGATSIFSSSADIGVGGYTGSGSELIGKVHRIVIRNVVNDQTVLDIDFSKANPTSATFAAETGQTVTINRSSTGRKSVVVDRDLFLFGTDDYMEALDHPDLDFATGDSFTVVGVRRRYGAVPAGSVVLVGKKGTAAASSIGWMLYENPAGVYGDLADGTVDAFPGKVSSANIVETLVLRRDPSTAVIFVDGVSGTPLADPTASLHNSLPLRVGNYGATTGYHEMEFIGAAIFRKALTDAEIALLPGEFGV